MLHNWLREFVCAAFSYTFPNMELNCFLENFKQTKTILNNYFIGISGGRYILRWKGGNFSEENVDFSEEGLIFQRKK